MIFFAFASSISRRFDVFARFFFAFSSSIDLLFKIDSLFFFTFHCFWLLSYWCTDHFLFFASFFSLFGFVIITFISSWGASFLRFSSLDFAYFHWFLIFFADFHFDFDIISSIISIDFFFISSIDAVASRVSFDFSMISLLLFHFLQPLRFDYFRAFIADDISFLLLLIISFFSLLLHVYYISSSSIFLAARGFLIFLSFRFIFFFFFFFSSSSIDYSRFLLIDFPLLILHFLRWILIDAAASYADLFLMMIINFSLMYWWIIIFFFFAEFHFHFLFDFLKIFYSITYFFFGRNFDTFDFLFLRISFFIFSPYRFSLFPSLSDAAGFHYFPSIDFADWFS